MLKVVHNAEESNEPGGASLLDGLVRDAARQMLAVALRAEVAAANVKEKGATLKAIIRDHVEGANGRSKIEGWVPKWMAFPPAAYTARGGVGTVIGALVGALIMASLDNGMSMLGVETFWQQIVKGVILVLAVWMDIVSSGNTR